MANWFDAIAGGAQQDPFAAALSQGGRAPTAVPRPASMAPSGPSMQSYNPMMAADGPLANAGWIGALIAQGPTREQVAMQNAGVGRSIGFQKLASLVASGTPPQKALMEFVMTPEGQQMLINDPDGMQEAVRFVTTMKPQDLMQVGNQIFDPETRSVVHQAPTAEKQKFLDMSELAGLSASEMRELARASMVKDITGDPTQEEAAMGRLVEAGLISRDMADQFLGGIIKIQPIKDQAGDTKGFAIVNMQTGEITIPDASTPSKVDVPDQSEAKPGTGLRRVLDYTANPADIVDGAGVAGTLGEVGGGLLGNVMPSLSGERYRVYRSALAQIRLDANAIRGNITDSGRAARYDLELIDNVIHGVGPSTNPLQAAESLISWHDYLDQRLEKVILEEGDTGQTNEVRGAAASERAAIAQAKLNLPSRDLLVAKVEQLRKALGPIPQGVIDLMGVEPQAEKELGEGVKAATGGGKTYTFKTEEELQRALNDGSIGVGDSFRLEDGRTGRIEE